jgi:hypothetical protein
VPTVTSIFAKSVPDLHAMGCFLHLAIRSGRDWPDQGEGHHGFEESASKRPQQNLPTSARKPLAGSY